MVSGVGTQIIDRSIRPLRDFGRMKLQEIGIRAYVEPTAVTTGTAIAGGVTDAEIIAGGETIIITIGQGELVPAGATFDATRQAIIDALMGDPDFLSGFDEVVVPELAVTDVARTSATQITITLPAAAAYAIPADETVRVNLPASVIRDRSVYLVPSLPSVVVEDSVPTIAVTGTMESGGVGEAAIVSGGETIIVTITGDTFQPAGAAFNATRQGFIDGLVSDGEEAAGWNAEVVPAMAVTAVARTSATVVTITLPAVAGYSIDAEETVTVTVPAAAIRNHDADVVAAPVLPITPAS